MDKGCLPGLPIGSGVPGAGMAAAWVKFNGANGNIQASYNVRSVVRNALGDFTITFLRPFTTPHFACLITAQRTAGNNVFGEISNLDPGTGMAKRINFLDPVIPTSIDPATGHFVAFGEC